MNNLDTTPSRLIRSMLHLRVGIFMIQSILILAGAWITWSLLKSIQDKYFLSLSLPALLFIFPLILVFGAKALLQYRRESKVLRIADRIDGQFGLKDRCRTYVEFQDKGHPFFPALANELEGHLSHVRATSATDFKKGIVPPAIFVIFAILITIAMPLLPVPVSVEQKKQEKKQLARASTGLVKAVKSFPKTERKKPEISELLKEFEKTATELKKPEMDRMTALKNFNDLQQKLEKTGTDIAKSSQSEFSKKLGDLTKLKPGEGTTPALDPQQAAKLAEELTEALNGKDPAGQEILDKLHNGQFSTQDAQKLKESLESYKAGQEESKRRLADLKEQLEGSRKAVVSDKAKVTYDSTIKERDSQKSKGGVEDGPGTTNMDIGPHHFDTKKHNAGEYTEDRTRAKYEKLYKGERENAGSDPLYLPSQWGEKSKYSKIRDFGLESESMREGVSLPVNNQDARESVISKEKIPASYRKMVKEYLDSLQH